MGNIEQVIVLGAGASQSEGAPSQSDLFKEFFDYNIKNKEKIGESFHNQERCLAKFFEKFWNINIEDCENNQFPTFEECLGVLDLAYIRRESFSGFSRNEIDETRNALIFLIGKILDETLKNKPAKNHQNLINNLEKEGNLENTAFISFNYDLIIDNVLFDLNNSKELFLDYGIDFINHNHPKMEINNPISLYKIHGSLNWLYCPTCNKMIYTKGQKKPAYTSIHEIEPCKECKMPLENVIVPPTYYKDMNNLFIQKIFLKSEKVLRHADKIFFCGYSFPDSDIHFKYILKRAELFNKKSPKVFIINKNPEKKYSEDDLENEKNRISRIFKDKENVNFTDLSFKEFCENVSL